MLVAIRGVWVLRWRLLEGGHEVGRLWLYLWRLLLVRRQTVVVRMPWVLLLGGKLQLGFNVRLDVLGCVCGGVEAMGPHAWCVVLRHGRRLLARVGIVIARRVRVLIWGRCG